MTKIKLSKIKKLFSKRIAILFVVLVLTLLLFNESISAFLGEKINIPFINNPNKTIQTTPQQDSIKTIKSTCVSEVKKFVESDNLIDNSFTEKAEKFKTKARSEGWSEIKINTFIEQKWQEYLIETEEFVWRVNSKYRFCLAENDLTPEDLLSSQESTNYSESIDSNSDSSKNSSTIQNSVKNLFEEAEKDELERKQECQDKMNKYNICLSEYNSQVSKYNLCMNNPDKPSWSCGSVPRNSCFKPIGCR